MPLSKSKQNSFNKLILKFLFDCFSSLQQQSLLIYRPGLLKSFYSLFYIYESCFLLRNNNFFSVHTPAYRTRKDIKLRVIPFIGITSMNESPRKTLDKQYVYILYLEIKKKSNLKAKTNDILPRKHFVKSILNVKDMNYDSPTLLRLMSSVFWYQLDSKQLYKEDIWHHTDI